MDSTSPDHLSTPSPFSHLTRRHLSCSFTLARAGHPVVTVHVTVAMATSATSPPRPGRSRPSSTLATARHHLRGARSDNPSPPRDRLRRGRVPSLRRAADRRLCRQLVSPLHCASDARSRPNLGTVHQRHSGTALLDLSRAAAHREPPRHTVSTVHRPAWYKTAQDSSTSTPSPPEPHSTPTPPLERRGAPFLPAGRDVARIAVCFRRRWPSQGSTILLPSLLSGSPSVFSL
jgi:hypothetical protein